MAVNENSGTSPIDTLDVGVIGAGIAGLAATIGLARAGHRVEVFEKSRFANEIGSAINVCPNATRILTKWGFDFEKYSGTVAEGIRVRNEETDQIKTFVSYGDFKDRYGYEFYLLQRVDLHAGLKEIALALGVKLTLACEIVDLDCAAGSITTKDDKTICKDLLVVADGVHAKFTHKIAGLEAAASHTGQNAFRWQIPKSKLLSHPAMKDFVDKSYPGINIGFSTSAERTRLVWYPCKRGQMFNFTGIHPHKVHGVEDKGWDKSSNVSDLVETYKFFGKSIIEVCKNAEEVKLWPLYAQQPLETWTRGKTVAIGDSIHAMLPHHGQGGGMALEDGACLEVLFNKEGQKNSLPNILKLFQNIRKDRCTAIQIMSTVGQDQVATLEHKLQPFIDGPTPKSLDDIHDYNFCYDVAQVTQESLDAAYTG